MVFLVYLRTASLLTVQVIPDAAMQARRFQKDGGPQGAPVWHYVGGRARSIKYSRSVLLGLYSGTEGA